MLISFSPCSSIASDFQLINRNFIANLYGPSIIDSRTGCLFWEWGCLDNSINNSSLMVVWGGIKLIINATYDKNRVEISRGKFTSFDFFKSFNINEVVFFDKIIKVFGKYCFVIRENTFPFIKWMHSLSGKFVKKVFLETNFIKSITTFHDWRNINLAIMPDIRCYRMTNIFYFNLDRSSYQGFFSKFNKLKWASYFKANFKPRSISQCKGFLSNFCCFQSSISGFFGNKN